MKTYTVSADLVYRFSVVSEVEAISEEEAEAIAREEWEEEIAHCPNGQRQSPTIEIDYVQEEEETDLAERRDIADSQGH